MELMAATAMATWLAVCTALEAPLRATVLEAAEAAKVAAVAAMVAAAAALQAPLHAALVKQMEAMAAALRAAFPAATVAAEVMQMELMAATAMATRLAVCTGRNPRSQSRTGIPDTRHRCHRRRSPRQMQRYMYCHRSWKKVVATMDTAVAAAAAVVRP